MRHFLERFFRGFFLVFFLLSIFSGWYFFVRRVIDGIPRYLLAAAVTAFFGVILSRIAKKHEFTRPHWWESLRRKTETGWRGRLFILFLVPLLLRLLVIPAFYFESGGDIAVYKNIAYELAHEGAIRTHAVYAWDFPHLFWYGVFLLPAGVLTEHYFGYAVYTALLDGIATILVYQGILRGGGYKASEERPSGMDNEAKRSRAAFLTAMLLAYLPSQIFSALTVTHEKGFQFLLALVFFLTAYLPKGKLAYFVWLPICALFVLMKALNPMGYVAAIAMVLVLLLGLWKREQSMIFRVYACILLGTVIISSTPVMNAIQLTFTQTEEKLEDQSFLISFYVGGNAESEGRLYAGFQKEIDTAVEERYGKMSVTQEEKNEVLEELTFQRWRDLAADPLRLSRLLLDKFAILWGGTHYSIELAHVYMDDAGKKIASLGILMCNNLFNLCLLYLAFLRVCSRRKFYIPDYLYFAILILLGGTLVLLFTEAMNKYNLSLLYPLFMVYGAVLVGNTGEEKRDTFHTGKKLI